MSYISTCLKKHVSFKIFKYCNYIIACLFLILLCNRQYKNINFIRKSFYVASVSDERNPQETHANIVNSYIERRMDWPTSNLGTLLFKKIPISTMSLTHVQKNKTYKVLIWKYWNWLKHRHIYNFRSKRKVHPLQECSVKNCKFTGDDRTISSADAVIVHVQHGVFPNTTLRNPKQRWVFLNDESPMHSFVLAKHPPNLADLSNMFNWSMTYRSDSDVPVPYGRTMPLKTPILNYLTDESLSSLVPYWNDKRTDVLVSILISGCGNHRRMDYLQKLQEHLKVDIYGKCSKDKKTRGSFRFAASKCWNDIPPPIKMSNFAKFKSLCKAWLLNAQKLQHNCCPGHYKSDCKVITEYLFYLVLENSECDEYLTEKLFHNAYSKGAIPVIMGPTVDRCDMLLPPESFLHVDEYSNPEELAKHMIEISKNSSKLLSFHRWRNHFYVANEHGYFGTKSYHLCRICEALNYNDQELKYYDEKRLRTFFDPALSCR